MPIYRIPSISFLKACARCFRNRKLLSVATHRRCGGNSGKGLFFYSYFTSNPFVLIFPKEEFVLLSLLVFPFKVIEPIPLQLATTLLQLTVAVTLPTPLLSSLQLLLFTENVPEPTPEKSNEALPETVK